ncbi:uncharacterized protein LOC109861535 [Pseudomyrmex gracilis]|uniref:uncharacterized protein LOC109861535 n=1 Tax=Pseudomyrmex gracilis TaxID=219809 RepID=UPI000994ACA5|nr:uncharacterized protein LOC109861535 [Pseudomyrmex gracilis]
MHGSWSMQPFELFAANGTQIRTFGITVLQPILGLRRAFPWRFIIADVEQPIIGADFLAYYHLLTDVTKKRLIDGKTGLHVSGTTSYAATVAVKLVKDDSRYHKIISQFPGITRPGGIQKPTKHATEHHIATTPGQPEACRPRRLAPDKLKAAKAEFDLLLQEEIIRASKSPWAAPLHMVPKRGEA